MEEIIIKSSIKNFSVTFVDDFNFINQFIQTDNYIVIVDKNVFSLYKKKLFEKLPKEKVIVILFQEKTKTLDTVNKIYEKLLHLTAKKNLTILAFGGGITQDVVGFVASTLYRGIRWIYIPTTLLAMADSAIGLKTSLNFKQYKNVLGTFYPPTKVFININFLKTLPKREYYSGIGEIVKFYLMKKSPIDALEDSIAKINKLKVGFDKIEMTQIIRESIKIKISYMEGDEFDTGRRNLLNYGHEFGHALEPSSGFFIPHGIGVIIGMIFANCVSLNRGYINKDLFKRINLLLLIPNIPQDIVKLKNEHFIEKILFENMKKDKKRTTDDLVLILPKDNFSLDKIQDLGYTEFSKNLKLLKDVLGLI